MPKDDFEGISVIIPLFSRPVRAAFTPDREIRGDQLRTLAGAIQRHLLDLVPVVDTLKRSGWEVVGGETALICRHPSVRTRGQAQVALSLLGVDGGWYSVCDSAELEQFPPASAEIDKAPAAAAFPNDRADTRGISASWAKVG